jgi:hypothetical protein
VKSFTRFRYISYLDLVCCGFGGALLLFLIAASASSISLHQGPLNEMVVVRSHKGGTKAEIGIEFERPSAKGFQQPGSAHPDVRSFSARSGNNSGGESFLVLMGPEAGLWRFRVWQKDFPAGALLGDGRVELEVIGQDLERLEDETHGREEPLRWPGDLAARIVRVRIGRR